MQPATSPKSSLVWYRQRWVKWTAVVVVALAVLAAIIAAAAFAIWNNSPQKALLDATNYALKTPGVYHFTSDVADIDFTANHQQYAVTGTIDGVQVDAVVLTSTLYLKSSDPQHMYDLFTGSSPDKTNSLTKSLLKTVKNRWVEINMSSPPIKATGIDATNCWVAGKDVLANDDRARQEVLATYLTHQFMTVSPQGQATYHLAFDSAKLSSFLASLSETQAYQSVPVCSQTLNLSQVEVPSGMAATVTLTADKHALSSIEFTDESGRPAKLTADYDKVPAVVIPADAVTLDELAGKVFQSFFGQLLDGSQ